MKNRRSTNWAFGLAVIGFIGSGGCGRDSRLAGHNVRRNVTAHAVSYYGQTLDESASPNQVAFAVLRAIRDDFLAKDRAEREAALDKQFDLCAADVIASRNQTGEDRDEYIYLVVHRWTPTVSHYVHDFETEWEKAKERLVALRSSPMSGSESGTLETQVVMEVGDPGGDPNAGVVLVVYLAQDRGLWRVTHLGFASNMRSLRDGGSRTGTGD